MPSNANPLTADLLIEIPKRFPQCRVWRNNRVEATVTGRNGKPRHISAGIDGQADICGIAGPRGLMLQIEVKVGKDQQSDTQAGFQDMVEQRGGVYIIARELEETLATLADYMVSA